MADAERAITAVQDGYKARFNMNRSPCARTEVSATTKGKSADFHSK